MSLLAAFLALPKQQRVSVHLNWLKRALEHRQGTLRKTSGLSAASALGGREGGCPSSLALVTRPHSFCLSNVPQKFSSSRENCSCDGCSSCGPLSALAQRVHSVQHPTQRLMLRDSEVGDIGMVHDVDHLISFYQIAETGLSPWPSSNDWLRPSRSVARSSPPGK